MGPVNHRALAWALPLALGGCIGGPAVPLWVGSDSGGDPPIESDPDVPVDGETGDDATSTSSETSTETGFETDDETGTTVGTGSSTESGSEETGDPEPLCGDAEVDEGEECDDGNADSSDGCLSNCTVPTSCAEIKAFEPNAPSGPHEIDPDGEGAYSVFCEMAVSGGGWQLISSRSETAGALFAHNVCLDARQDCSGRIPERQVADRGPDVLIATDDGAFWIELTGLSSPGEDGFTDMLSLQRPINESDSCAYPNHCAFFPLDPELSITGHSENMVPRHMNLTTQYMRQGGIWFGDGGGAGENHVVSLNYWNYCFGNGGLDLSGEGGTKVGDVRCSANGAIYFR